jgi:hypothetical protein
VSARRVSARAARRVAGIGQRWRQPADDKIVVIRQVHRGVEAHPERADPRVPHPRFQLAFAELAGEDEPLDVAAREAT